MEIFGDQTERKLWLSRITIDLEGYFLIYYGGFEVGSYPLGHISSYLHYYNHVQM